MDDQQKNSAMFSGISSGPLAYEEGSESDAVEAVITMDTIVTVDKKGRCTFDLETPVETKETAEADLAISESSKVTENKGMDILSQKRKADTLTKETDTENASKKIKLGTESCEAILTVTEKGKCSFEILTDEANNSIGEGDDSTSERLEDVIPVANLSSDVIDNKTVCENIEAVSVCVEESSDISDCVPAEAQVKRLDSTGSDAGLGTSIEEESECPAKLPDTTEYVALDCEFVGVKKWTDEGLKLDISALGRCSIVDYDGNILCDIYARPKDPICHYRTKWSGITKKHMQFSIPSDVALQQISDIIKGKIVVGHALKNDFDVLEIAHPAECKRDTSLYRPFIQQFGAGSNVSLKRLASNILDLDIQKGSHCSVVDARTTMNVFKSVREEWERSLANGQLSIAEPVTPVKKKKKKSRKKKTLNPVGTGISKTCEMNNDCDNATSQRTAQNDQGPQKTDLRSKLSKSSGHGNVPGYRERTVGTSHSSRRKNYDGQSGYNGYRNSYGYASGETWGRTWNGYYDNRGPNGYVYQDRRHPRNYNNQYYLNNYFQDQFWPDN